MLYTEIYPSADPAFATIARRMTGELAHVDAGAFETNQALADAVGCALRATGRTSLRNVVVKIGRDTVFLRGRLPSYYEKQLAQAMARQVARNLRVVNEIEVVSYR